MRDHRRIVAGLTISFHGSSEAQNFSKFVKPWKASLKIHLPSSLPPVGGMKAGLKRPDNSEEARLFKGTFLYLTSLFLLTFWDRHTASSPRIVVQHVLRSPLEVIVPTYVHKDRKSQYKWNKCSIAIQTKYNRIDISSFSLTCAGTLTSSSLLE